MESETSHKKIPLTETEAKIRKHHVLVNNHYNVQYNVLLKLVAFDPEHPSNSTYRGRVEVCFIYNNTNSTPTSLFLDFFNTVQSVSINGIHSDATVKDMKLALDPSLLKHEQKNSVVILFTSKYTNNGSGLHAYTDPSDKKSYLYTQFEPFDCHQVFPCFDQPDIKAFLKLNVIAPNNWKVFANEETIFTKPLNKNTINDLDIVSVFHCLEDSDENHLFDEKFLVDGLYNLHSFKKTPRISPYLYALCAGEYYSYHNPYDFKIPMKLMVRDSLRSFGELKEIFRVTMAGVLFYERFFGQPYPFSKYDQIFCPEYNMGAMENVGLVTLNEYYCWRSTPTQRQRTGFAITNLHELAHMWFGNLVTMTWWNDLWLNESFATFISHLCLAEAPELKDYTTSWLIFNSLKGGAYRADQLSTTHPVMSEVKNTEIAESHFDEIVYEKGSSILKQIFYAIGKDNFHEGLVEYFKTFKWDNTVFSEFIEKMDEAMPEHCSHKHKLTKLSEEWLTKAGLNELQASFEVANNKVEKFSVDQTPCLDTFPNRVTHIMDIQFIYANGELENFYNITINPEKSTDLTHLFGGKRAPAAVIVNYNDWAYIKWVIDQTSLAYFKNHLHDIKDTLTKQMIYRSLFDLVRDAKMSALDYLEIVKKHVIFETDQDILTTTIRMVAGTISNYIPTQHYIKYTSSMFDLVVSLIAKGGHDDDTLRNFVRYLLQFACSEEHRVLFVSWFKDGPFVTSSKGEKIPIKSSLLSQENRFSLVTFIHESKTISLDEKTKLMEKEIENDKNSDQSVEFRHACYAARPEPEIKKELWEKYTNKPTSESLVNMQSSMGQFVSRDNLDIIAPYVKERFFEDVFKVAGNVDRFYMVSYVNSLSPYLFVCEEMIEKLQALNNKATDDTMKKEVSNLVDDMKRKLKAHKLCC